MICLSIISLFIFILCLSLKEYNNNEVLKDSNSLKNYNINTISMMYETEANSGIYEANKNTLWPSDGYIFNATLSKCENGSELSWDESAKKIIMSGNTSDKCYVYFDAPSSLANYIKNLYTDGSNGLYYHNSSLTNGANDNSYRYAGSYETTNNWVCFGSDEETCPVENLYRVIGLFNEKKESTNELEERVKLIKAYEAGVVVLGAEPVSLFETSGFSFYKGNLSKFPVYYWCGSCKESSKNDIWTSSTLNTEILNGTYLAKLGAEWANKIATTEWSIGGNTSDKIYSVKPSITYQNEILNPESDGNGKNKAYAKVGLIYASDYGFAASKDIWSTTLNAYNTDTIRSNNWLFLGLPEWLISRFAGSDPSAFLIARDGSVSVYDTYTRTDKIVRPSFYLNANVSYISGTGTQTNPIRIS